MNCKYKTTCPEYESNRMICYFYNFCKTRKYFDQVNEDLRRKEIKLFGEPSAKDLAEHLRKLSGIVKVLIQGNQNKFSSKTKAKDFRGWIEARIGLFSKRNNEEYKQVFMEILKAYNYFNPVKQANVDIKSWKGKSGVEVIKGLDRLILVRHQKPNKNEEPKEIRMEIDKEEIIAVVNAIRRLSTMYESIETKDLALEYCNLMGIRTNDKGEDLLGTGNFWEKFFNWRRMHNRFTTILSGLNELELISYSDGKTKLLNKELSVQLVLE